MSNKRFTGSMSLLGKVYTKDTRKKKKLKAPQLARPFKFVPETPAPTIITPKPKPTTETKTTGCGGYERIGSKPYKSEAEKPVLIGFKILPEAERQLVDIYEGNKPRFASRADMYRWAIETALGVSLLTDKKRARIEAEGPVLRGRVPRRNVPK